MRLDKITLFSPRGMTFVLLIVLIPLAGCPPWIFGNGNGTCNMCNPDVIAAYNAPRTGTLTEIYVENCSDATIDFNIYVPGSGWGTGVWLEPQKYMKYQYPGWSGQFGIQWREWPSGEFVGEPDYLTLVPGGAGFFTWCGNSKKSRCAQKPN